MDAIGSFFGTVIFFLLITAGVVGYFVIREYNSVQAMLQYVLASHANVAASMMKRLDLITKLMEVVKGYADHAMLTTTVMAPATAMTLSSNMNYISKIAAQIPDLRTNEAYQRLMEQLSLVENDLQNKRESYNSEVRKYNTKICQFPLNLLASTLGFKPAAFVSPEDADSIEKMKEFTSNDGEAVRQLLSIAAAKVISGSKQLSESMATTGKTILRERMASAHPAQAETASKNGYPSEEAAGEQSGVPKSFGSTMDPGSS